MQKIYSQHAQAVDDLFLCNVCDAILVSEQGMVEHLQTQHREELHIMDIENISQETEAGSSELPEDHNSEASQTGEDSGYEGDAEGTRAPKIDMTFVQRQFYVCCHCDDVFLDKKHLRGHIIISHDLIEKNNDSPDVSTIDSPPQSPKPKRFKRRVLEKVGLKVSEVTRVGINQTQTPRNTIIPLPPVKNTPQIPSSVIRAVCLPEKMKNEATSQGADKTSEDKNVSLGLEDNNKVREDTTNKEFKKDLRKSVGSKPGRSKKLSPQKHAIETDVGCKSSPRKEPISEETLDPSLMKASTSLPKKRKLNPPPKDKSSPPAFKESGQCDIKKSKSLKATSKVAMEYQCPICGDCKDKQGTFKKHFLTNYKKLDRGSIRSSPRDGLKYSLQID